MNEDGIDRSRYVHQGPHGTTRSRAEYSPDKRLTYTPFKAAALYAAVTNEWWTSFLDFLFDLGTQVTADHGCCTECGHKNTMPGLPTCTACDHPFGGHADSTAEDAPLSEHAGFDG